MVFETLFCLGMVGFIAMAAMGLLHGHGDSGHEAGHHGGHLPDAGHHIGHDAGHHGAPLPDVGHAAPAGHGAHAHGHEAVHHGGADHSAHSETIKLPAFLSPMTIFSFCIGAGAAGILARPWAPGVWVYLVALVAGIVFTKILVAPLMKLIYGFVSKPSTGLEGSIAHTAEAVSAFDSTGKGLVKVILDGEVVQLLASLEQSERERGVQVRRGDQVLVTEVDSGRSRCRVSKDLA